MAKVKIVLEDGDTIESVVGLASTVAKATRQTLDFYFNSYVITVGPSHNPEVVIKDYVKRASSFRGEDI